MIGYQLIKSQTNMSCFQYSWVGMQYLHQVCQILNDELAFIVISVWFFSKFLKRKHFYWKNNSCIPCILKRCHFKSFETIQNNTKEKWIRFFLFYQRMMSSNRRNNQKKSEKERNVYVFQTFPLHMLLFSDQQKPTIHGDV